jgi:hypothetical protein
VERVPVKLYPALRTVHLLCGVFSVPLLAMYGVSAVQMAHSRWFVLKPAVSEVDVALGQGLTDGRALARAVMERRGIRGEIRSIDATVGGFDVRIVVPGTEHAIRYERSTGRAHVRSSVAGFMGMLNRLHHAAGLWPQYVPLRWWGALCGVVSLATIGLGASGLWMWWVRRKERKWGLVLLAANAVFAIVVLGMLRSAGP